MKKAAPPSPIIEPSIPHIEPGCAIGAATAIVTPSLVSLATVRLPIDDVRAERVLKDELHHFQQAEMNLLMIDITQIVRGRDVWPEIIRRWFQPGRNRRIGAVILFEGATVVPKAQRWERWRVYRNPYAYHPLPDSLLDEIASLDNGSYVGPG